MILLPIQAPITLAVARLAVHRLALWRFYHSYIVQHHVMRGWLCLMTIQASDIPAVYRSAIWLFSVGAPLCCRNSKYSDAGPRISHEHP